MLAISDRAVSVLGMLMVDQTVRGSGSLAMYAPFVYHCLAKSADEAVSTPVLQQSLRDDWGIQLPQAVINRILKRAQEDEKVSLVDGVYRTRPENLSGNDLSAARAEAARAGRELVDGVRAFAKEHFELEWSEQDAADATHRYLDAFSSRVLAAAVTGGDIEAAPPKIDPDRYVIHRFASHVNAANQRLFDALLTRVKGRMLADCMYYVDENREEVPSLERVEIYLDGPVLLFVLGYAGPEVQGQYTELLEMLTTQAAVVRCFEHSVTEAREILDAAASKARTGQTGQGFHGDVVSHLVRSDNSPEEIEILSNRLPNDLLRLGINPVETPARKEHLQSDETALDAQLQRRLGYSHKVARERDIDSLTAIYRLRDGREFRNLNECRALFVTHNFSLFRTATAFFRGRDRKAVPPCAHDAALTTMLWLREPVAAPDLPRDRILGDAYAALNPKPELWLKYHEEIERLRSEGTLQEEDAVFLRYGREAQEVLMDETRGDADAFTSGTVAQVLRRAREIARADADQRVASAEDREHAVAGQLRVSQNRIAAAARGIGDFVATGVLVIVSFLILIGLVYGPVGPVQEPFVPGVLQLVAAVMAVGASVVTMFFRPTLLEHRQAAASWIAQRLNHLGLRALGLNSNESQSEPGDS